MILIKKILLFNWDKNLNQIQLTFSVKFLNFFLFFIIFVFNFNFTLFFVFNKNMWKFWRLYKDSKQPFSFFKKKSFIVIIYSKSLTTIKCDFIFCFCKNSVFNILFICVLCVCYTCTLNVIENWDCFNFTVQWYFYFSNLVNGWFKTHTFINNPGLFFAKM